MSQNNLVFLDWQSGPTRVSLAVAGYQYPDHPLESSKYYSYDANWLNIKLIATNGTASWEAVDPCLLTSDLVKLQKWFLDGINKKRSKILLDFIEPLIKFRRTRRTKGFMELSLGGRFSPPEPHVGFLDFVPMIAVSVSQVESTIGSIRECLKAYPVREPNVQLS